MKISILSLFPHMFDGFLTESIIARAIKNKKVEIEIIDFRKYSHLSNNQVDDTPYGGGAGMVLRCEPIFEAIDDIKTDDSYIIILSPEGKTYNEQIAKRFANIKHLIIICGHYEGFDERIKSLANEIISIGDFILTGGELPAMMICDSVIRLLNGVINKESLENESFNDDLLDYPVYTKPEEYRGMRVPEILLSGNHQKIAEYRQNERIRVTNKRNNLKGE